MANKLAAAAEIQRVKHFLEFTASTIEFCGPVSLGIDDKGNLLALKCMTCDEVTPVDEDLLSAINDAFLGSN